MRDKEKDEAEKAVRMARVIESGFALFAEKGIEPVTMPDIAEASGLARATLYRYFSSKTELVIEIGTRKWAEYIKEHREVLPENKPEMTAARRLWFYLDSFIDLYRNHSDILRFNHYFNGFVRKEGATDEQLLPYMEIVRALGRRFHDIYELGRQDGTLDMDISEEMMFSGSFHIMLAAVTRYAIGLVYVPDNGTDPESELIMLKDLLLAKFIKEP